MINLDNISILVGVKDNLEYTKKFYEYTRKIYTNIPIVMVTYGSNKDTFNWMNETIKSDDNFICHYSPVYKSLSDTYNKAVELCETEYFVFTHNDMVLLPNFLENICKHLDGDNVVCYSLIEPPVFSDDVKETKIISNYGINFNELNYDKLILEYTQFLKNKISNETSFFLSTNKSTYYKIGIFDNLFSPMFCEDDDFLYRMQQKNVTGFTTLNSLVYHFVSKTSRFSDDFKSNTLEIEKNSTKNYIRKWGYKHLKVNGKYEYVRNYNIGMITNNISEQFFSFLETHATIMYTNNKELNNSYISLNSDKTKFNLNNRVKHITELQSHEVLIEVDCDILSPTDVTNIRQIRKIIQTKIDHTEKNQIFKLGNILIKIFDLS